MMLKVEWKESRMTDRKRWRSIMKSKRKLIRSNWLYWKRNRKQKLWLLIKEKVIDWLVFRPINQISLRNNNRR